jgi:DGQHR domain-containing protein
MITLQGMRLRQRGYTLYLTSATVEELKNWHDADRIYPDIWKREKPEGYQRVPDMQRAMKIAQYVEGNLQIEETLLPNSLILNIRQKGLIDFDAFEKSKSEKTIEFGTISIYDEALPFFEVDGQHRIRGLIEAYKELKEKRSDDFEEIRSYPVPLTIMEGLDRATEALQFVVINNDSEKG